MSKFSIGDKVTWKFSGDDVWKVAWSSEELTVAHLEGTKNVALNAPNETFTLLAREPKVGDVYRSIVAGGRVRILETGKRIVYAYEKDILDRTKQDFTTYFEHVENG